MPGDRWIAPTPAQREKIAALPGSWGNLSPLSGECFMDVAVTRGLDVADLTTSQLALHVAALDNARNVLELRAQIARAELAKQLL